MNKSKLMVAAVLMGALISTSTFAHGPGDGYRFNQKNTPGWALMTKEERADFRSKMLASKTYDECKEIQATHHELMVQRAKTKGVELPVPRSNACDNMKAHGLFK